MEANIRRRAIRIELDPQRRRMRRKAQLGRNPLRARRIITRADGKLSADFDVRIVRDDGGVPGGEAIGVSVVCTTFGACGGKGAVVVQLFTGVGVVDVDVVFAHVVDAVLNGPLLWRVSSGQLLRSGVGVDARYRP